MKKFTKPTAPARIESANNLTCGRFLPTCGSRGFFLPQRLRMKLFFVVLDGLSTPATGHGFGKRALLNTFAFADSKKEAEERAILHLNLYGWLIVEPFATFGRSCSPADDVIDDWKEAYVQAEKYGVGFHVWLSPVDQPELRRCEGPGEEHGE